MKKSGFTLPELLCGISGSAVLLVLASIAIKIFRWCWGF